MQKRFENVDAVEVEIDANGWPSVTIYPKEGNPHSVTVRPNGNAAITEHVPHKEKLW